MCCVFWQIGIWDWTEITDVRLRFESRDIHCLGTDDQQGALLDVPSNFNHQLKIDRVVVQGSIESNNGLWQRLNRIGNDCVFSINREVAPVHSMAKISRVANVRLLALQQAAIDVNDRVGPA